MSSTSAPDAVTEALALHGQRPGALLPVLHEIQDRIGHVPAERLPQIARALNLSRAEVHGVVTFYHHFRQSPPGRHVLRVCVAESCQSMGATGLMDLARRVLGVDDHGTSADGAVTLEPVYCLGNCACSPAAMLDQAPLGRLDAKALEQVIADCRRPA